MLVDAAPGVFGSATPVVGGVGVLMSKFSGGGVAAPGGVVVVVLLAPDGVVVVVLDPAGAVVVELLSPDGVVVVVVEGASGAVAVSGAAAAFAAAWPLVGVPGGSPGVPRS
jgi:hypothetical protein